MKQIIKLLIGASFIPLIMFAVSCKKSDAGSDVVSSSKWIFNGITYNPSSTNLTVGLGMLSLSGTGSGQAGIHINLGRATPSNGTFTVVNGTGISSKLAANQCVIVVGTLSDTFYESIGAPGNTVTIAISGKKITATFNNITLVSMANGQIADTQNVSGTLVSVSQ